MHLGATTGRKIPFVVRFSSRHSTHHPAGARCTKVLSNPGPGKYVYVVKQLKSVSLRGLALLPVSVALSVVLAACSDAEIEGPAAALGDTRPNIVVVFTDDQGYSDLGVQGIAGDIKTPHIDQLAADGIRMTAGYSTAPQCTPSRAALVTGRYQQKFGVDDNNYTPMPLDEVTVAERLQQAGYKTGMVGKWHLEPNIKSVVVDSASLTPVERASYLPDQRGFDDVYVGYHKNWRTNYNYSGEDLPTLSRPNANYRLDVATNAALAFIDRHRNEPFFLYLSYYAPHLPLEATEAYLSRFPDIEDERRRYALAMMAAVDDGVGAVRERLQQYNLTQNTLVFFISDNGAPLGIYKLDLPVDDKAGEWDGSLNEPWVGEKGMLSEGGVRVPYIVSWPSKLPAGEVYDSAVSTLDVAATSLAAADAVLPDTLDGVDLLPHLSAYESQGTVNSLSERSLYWRFWSQSAVLKGRWKYLLAGEREFLFDMHENHENENLIGQHPDIAMALHNELVEWSASLYRPGLPTKPLNVKEQAWYDFYFEDSQPLE